MQESSYDRHLGMAVVGYAACRPRRLSSIHLLAGREPTVNSEVAALKACMLWRLK